MSVHHLTLLDEHALVARDGNVYIAAQPTEADLDAWAARGVKLVINLRSRAENAGLPFDPDAAAAARAMSYVAIPMGGADGVSPQIRERLTEALKSAQGPAALHCASGPRAVYAYAAHLLAEGEATPDDIADLGWPGPINFDVIAMMLAK
jgi:uncharacterized protein (TIGR01244 family)